MIRLFSFFLILIPLLMNCGGGGGDGGGGGGTVSLTGQVAVSDADANLSVPPRLRGATKAIQPKFTTTARAILPSATVTLFQMNADGTETQVDIGTVTTDESGNYTINNIPVASSGGGESGEFYYEVRATGGDVTVKSPTAPTEDTTVNVSPETHLAALMLTDVQDVSGDVLPRPPAIENLREMVLDEVGDNLADSIELPSLAEADVQVIAATAIAANGGNSEKGLATFEAEKEMLTLDVANTGASVDDVGAYLETVGKEACNFNDEFNLPEVARDAMANAFINDSTITPEEVVTAYNDNNGGDPDANVADVVANFDEMLNNVDLAIAEGEAISTDDQLGLFFKRDLTDDLFDSSTELKVDQAMALTQQLLPSQCEAGTFDVIGFVSDLTGADISPASDIVDVQVYHDSGFGCTTDGAPRGHLRAEVQVYAVGGATVNGVAITRGDTGGTQALTQDGMNGPFSRWTLRAGDTTDNDGDGDTTEADSAAEQAFWCFNLTSNITHTITVDLNGATDLTDVITRTHVEVDEADISMIDPTDGSETSMATSSRDNPMPTSQRRPIFKWDPAPGVPSEADIPDAPDDSFIKFTFELSFINKTDAQEAPLAACGTGGSDGKLMDRNYFIADVDCDTAACATASGVAQSNIVCRTNIQTFLVDENDRFLGQAAGNFRYYCTDSDDDGDCG